MIWHQFLRVSQHRKGGSSLKKEYESPDFDLIRFNFEKILEEGAGMRPSDNHVPKEDGDDNL